jgi:TIR domain
MSKIVISYRRSDALGTARNIFDRLAAHYGRDSVFMDIDSIPFGIDFREHINEALQECQVLVAVVGPNWLGARDQVPSRIMDENDLVRIEVEAALQRRIPVIPILVDQAVMPKVTDLPEGLKDFAFRNAAEVDVGRDFNQHVDRLLRSMDRLLAGTSGGLSAVEQAAGGPDHLTGPEPNLNAADGFKAILSRSKWAQALVANPDQLPEVRYEASMKSDTERIEARLKIELKRKLHDLLRLGKLTAWGRPEGHRPQRPIKPEEWDDIELGFEERDLTSRPPDICAWRHVPDIRNRRIVYVQVHFSKSQLFGQFPLIEAIIESGTPIAETPIAPSSAPIPPPPIPPKKPPKEFVEAHVTPDFLVGLYDGQTTLGAETRASKYVGKWMPVSGPLLEIVGGYPFLEVRTPVVASFALQGPSIIMVFHGEWIDRLAMIEKNQIMFVHGKISKIGRSKIVLDPCELMVSDPTTNASGQSPHSPARP